ncbi:MAG: replicative DNA helicase [Alphaproteobacteria bacterium]|nr:replicative DNA helicase [Alphaproteobacteria bacterium]
MLAANGDGDFGLAYRQPPANVDVEMALLGAILVNNRALEKVQEFLLPEHFVEPAHARIYDAIVRLTQRGQQASPATLRHHLEQDEQLAGVGGAQYLAQLAAAALNIIDAEDYGRTIHDLHLRRELIGLGEDVVNTAYGPDLDGSALDQIEAAEHRLYEIAAVGQHEGGFREFGCSLAGAIRFVEAAYRREGRLTGIPTGFGHLDRLLGGLQRSDLIVLASRPSMGKTSLATNIAFNAARALVEEVDEAGNRTSVGGHVIGFFSLEMSAEQLASRILAEQSGVPSDRMRRGQINNDDFQKVFLASQELSSLKLFIDDTPAPTVATVRTRARRLKRIEGRLDLVVIDYLQLLRPGGAARSDNRVQEISEITRGLKAVAKELNVPVLALSQLSRAVEQRDDKRPQLSDLRESGSIEQDSDVVMFIYREEYYLSRKEPREDTPEHDAWKADMEKVHNVAEVIVAKQRHGPIDRVRLMFMAELTRFGDPEPGSMGHDDVA